MIRAVMDACGGLENLVRAMSAVSPAFLEIDVSMWIKNSPQQEGGVIGPDTVNMLSQLGASLRVGFYECHEV